MFFDAPCSCCRKRIKREKEAAATKGRSDLAAPPKEQQAAAKLEEQEEAADEGPAPEVRGKGRGRCELRWWLQSGRSRG